MNTYANMLERAVVINSLKSEDIFSAIAELTDALVAAGSLPESKRDEAKQAMKGAYVVMDSAKAQVVMIASGSEVSTLIEGAEMLQKDGIAVRVVSVPSEGLFRDQPKSYQQSILLKDVPRYGLTSGLSMTLRGLVGEGGKIHGLDHFGYSAPYKVLDEKFGYNGQAVYEEVKALLK